MKKGMPTISIMPSMCSALKKMDISSNEGIKYCTFRNEGIKISKKKGAVRSTWGQEMLMRKGFTEESDI